MNKQNKEDTNQSSIINLQISEPQPMSRKTSSYVDLGLAKKEANFLLSGENADNELKKNLLFEEKSVTIFNLYGHLCQPIDYLYMFLGTIGCIGSGISMPIMAYLTSDLFSDIGNTSESISPDQIQNMREIVRKTMNEQSNKKIFIIWCYFICL